MSARAWQRRRERKRMTRIYAAVAQLWQEWIVSPLPDGSDPRRVASIANIGVATAPALTIDGMIQAFDELQAYSERPLLRYMSTAEWAVECVCLFLRWGLADDAAFGDDVHWVTPPDVYGESPAAEMRKVLDDLICTGQAIVKFDADP